VRIVIEIAEEDLQVFRWVAQSRGETVEDYIGQFLKAVVKSTTMGIITEVFK